MQIIGQTTSRTEELHNNLLLKATLEASLPMLTALDGTDHEASNKLRQYNSVPFLNTTDGAKFVMSAKASTDADTSSDENLEKQVRA